MASKLAPFLCAALVIFSTQASTSAAGGTPCNQRDFGWGSYVCVCNATYCDTVEPNTRLDSGQFTVYTSTKAGQRLTRTTGNFSHTFSSTDTEVVFSLRRDVEYQTIIGFGGAVTDAAGIVISSLTKEAQDHLLQSYYGPQGIEYTLGRVPMASCDFSTHEYSYDDHPGDFNLQHFSLAKEDLMFKIPLIQRSKQISRRNINLFASPWSAPAWMKTNHDMSGKGTIIGKPGGKYYQTWANYFIRFLEEYEKFNISFWGVTAENEPVMGLISNYSFQATGFTAEMQRDFILHDLGPALKGGPYKDVKLMILDDQRLMLPKWAQTVLATPDVAQYVDGIAVHWYADFIIPPLVLQETHKFIPDKFILATEACEGSRPWQQLDHVLLGSWDRFESYAHDIIEDLQHWVTGWTDWNIALDMEGGPNWVKNFVDSPVIVNKDRDEFYKQPMFYAMGHFSKCVLPDARRIEVEQAQPTKLEILAFTNPDKSTVFVVLNRQDQEVTFTVKDPERGIIKSRAPARSMMTFTWW